MSSPQTALNTTYNPVSGYQPEHSIGSSGIGSPKSLKYVSNHDPILGYQPEQFTSLSEIGSSRSLKYLSSFRNGYLKLSDTKSALLKLDLPNNKIAFTFKDKKTGLHLTINLAFNKSGKEGTIFFESFEPSVSATVLCTRLLYLFITAKQHFLTIPNGRSVPFQITPFEEPFIKKLLYRAKVFRKLLFIEETLNIDLGTIPKIISSDDISRIDVIVRGITRGNVLTKARNLTLYKSAPLDIDLNALQSTTPCPIGFDFPNGMQLFDHNIPVGLVNGIFVDAILENNGTFEESKTNSPTNIEIHFRAFRNEQLIFHFENYTHKTKQKRKELKEFRDNLLKVEPSVLADLVMLPMEDHVSDLEATEIGTAWLYSNLGDAPSPSCKPKQPHHDTKTDSWLLELWLQQTSTYIDSPHTPNIVVELTIDRKTGKIVDAPSIDQLQSHLIALKHDKEDTFKEKLPNSNIVLNKFVQLTLDTLSPNDKNFILKLIYSLDNFPNINNLGINNLSSNIYKTESVDSHYILRINKDNGILFQLNQNTQVEIIDLIPFNRFESSLVPFNHFEQAIKTIEEPIVKNIQFEFDPEKALETILYIAEHSVQSTVIYISRVLYYADKLHLSKYGRFICGDSYIAMNNGPAPCGVYNMLTNSNNNFKQIDSVKQTDQITDYTIKPLRNCDTDFLSESDLECLDQAIKEYNNMSFNELLENNHDKIYTKVKVNQEIPIELIIKHLPNSDDIFDYLEG